MSADAKQITLTVDDSLLGQSKLALSREHSDGIARRIEELQRKLENNKNNQMKIHFEIERLRPMVEKGYISRREIEEQEIRLKEAEMARQ